MHGFANTGEEFRALYDMLSGLGAKCDFLTQPFHSTEHEYAKFSWDKYLTKVTHQISEFDAEARNNTIYVATSFSALALATISAKFPIKDAILINPYLGCRPYQRALLSIAKALVPKLRLPRGEVFRRRNYPDNVLLTRWISPRSMYEIDVATQNIDPKVVMISNCLVLHSTTDPVANFKRSQDFFSIVPNVSFLPIDNAPHIFAPDLANQCFEILVRDHFSEG